MSVAKLKKQADKYFSQYIRLRDSEERPDGRYAECITCGVHKPVAHMQAGHFVSRRINQLRFDEENVNAQCVGCNMFKAGEQYLYAKALDQKYGAGTAEKLMSQRHQTHKFTVDELNEIIKSSKEQIKDYQ